MSKTTLKYKAARVCFASLLFATSMGCAHHSGYLMPGFFKSEPKEDCEYIDSYKGESDEILATKKSTANYLWIIATQKLPLLPARYTVRAYHCPPYKEEETPEEQAAREYRELLSSKEFILAEKKYGKLSGRKHGLTEDMNITRWYVHLMEGKDLKPKDVFLATKAIFGENGPKQSPAGPSELLYQCFAKSAGAACYKLQSKCADKDGDSCFFFWALKIKQAKLEETVSHLEKACKFNSEIGCDAFGRAQKLLADRYETDLQEQRNEKEMRVQALIAQQEMAARLTDISYIMMLERIDRTAERNAAALAQLERSKTQEPIKVELSVPQPINVNVKRRQ